MKIIAWFLRLISPGYGSCEICGKPWNWCNPKSVTFTEGEKCSRGGFATCQKCWDKCDIEEVKGAYVEVYWKYWRTAPEHLSHIIECVEQEYNKTH